MTPQRRRVTWALRPNVRATKYGLQVYTKAGGKFLSVRYRFTKTLTTPEALLAAREEEIAAWLAVYRDTPAEEAEAPEAGTLAADVATYLHARAAMPSLDDRKRDLQAWVEAFGPDRRRRSITPLEIQTVRDRWLTVGPKYVQRKGGRVRLDQPLSASAVNHRLRALSNLFRVLDHGRFLNPVLQVPEASEPAAVPRAVTYDVLHAILDKMPDRSRRLKGEKHKNIHSESLAKARVAVLMWTGMTPLELMRVDVADIDVAQQRVTVPPRRKGHGAPGRVIPLKHVPEGMAALKKLVRLHGLGPFDQGVVRRAFQRAARAAGHPGLSLYTMRHSWVTGVLGATGDFRQAQLLAGHQDARTTQRYAMAAVLPTLTTGMGKMRRHVMAKADARKKRAKAVS